MGVFSTSSDPYHITVSYTHLDVYKRQGFDIPDEFVVGYGIDFAQRNRNLPYIGKVRFTE